MKQAFVVAESEAMLHYKTHCDDETLCSGRLFGQIRYILSSFFLFEVMGLANWAQSELDIQPENKSTKKCYYKQDLEFEAYSPSTFKVTDRAKN